MKFQNFDVIPALALTLPFTLVDKDGVKLTGTSFKMDVSDTSGKAKFSLTTPASTGLGFVNMVIPQELTATFDKEVYSYRLFVTVSNSTQLMYEGFLAVRSPTYSSTVVPANAGIVLPDGTIYATSEIDILENNWYAIATFARYVITGASTIVLDGRDLRGTVYHNIAVYQEDGPSSRTWNPNLTGMTAFRLNFVWGSPTVKYLP